MKTFASESLFWLHAPVVLVWVGLFFVAESVLSGKTVFHFWYVMAVFVSQVIWGIYMMRFRGRFGVGVCPLTTLTQKTRGFALHDPRNYDRTFIQEFCERFGIPMPGKALAGFLLGTVVLVSLQYIAL